MNGSLLHKRFRLEVTCGCLFKCLVDYKPPNQLIWLVLCFCYQDSYSPSGPRAMQLSGSCVTSSNFASTTEGIIESGPYKGKHCTSTFLVVLSLCCICVMFPSLTEIYDATALETLIRPCQLITLFDFFAAFCVYKQLFSPCIPSAPLLGFDVSKIWKAGIWICKGGHQLNLMSFLWSPGCNPFFPLFYHHTLVTNANINLPIEPRAPLSLCCHSYFPCYLHWLI